MQERCTTACPKGFVSPFRPCGSEGQILVCSIEHARLIGGNHVLDVDEGVLAAMQLKKFQRLSNQVAQGLALDLPIVNTVTWEEIADEEVRVCTWASLPMQALAKWAEALRVWFTEILVGVLEDVENRKNLPIIRHESLADHLTRNHHLLQHLQNSADNLRIPRVERRLDGDDQLRDDGQDL
eukprot:scaffold263145_cov39-Tisochrysis_lutea.AAC.2